MTRASSLSRLLLRAALASSSRTLTATSCHEAGPVYSLLKGVMGSQTRSFNTSLTTFQESSPSVSSAAAPPTAEPPRKFRPLADKELWHEAWMYEDKFGTEEDPIIVPSLESERIIGVTDPEDETIVVWGILKDGEGPRQFVEGGEFYVLKVVENIKKVGDVLEEIESSKKTALPK